MKDEFQPSPDMISMRSWLSDNLAVETFYTNWGTHHEHPEKQKYLKCTYLQTFNKCWYLFRLQIVLLLFFIP